MLKMENVYKIINEFAPFRLAESWDNVGLLVGDMDKYVTGILLALDVTENIIKEALEENVNLIITHHPTIFHPLTSISSKDLVYKLIESNISLVSAHTNLDMADRGVNYALAKALELENIKLFSQINKENHLNIEVYVPMSNAEDVYSAMINAKGGQIGKYSDCGFLATGEGRFTPGSASKPAIGNQKILQKVEEVKIEMQFKSDQVNDVISAIKKSHPYEEPVYNIFADACRTHNYTYGRIGSLKQEMTSTQLANFAKEILCATTVRYTRENNKISRVAVMGGSGGDFLDEAITLGADAFITGEIKHSQILKANANGVTIIDVGHFASENIVMPELKQLLQEKVNANIIISKTSIDGIIGIV